MNNFCRHYPERGVMNTHCAAGIEMRSVVDTSTRPFDYPCYNPTIKHLCSFHAPHTKEEIAESDANVRDFIRKLNAFGRGESRACPICGTAVDTIDLYEKLEPDMYSLYTRPCNHRHGLWRSAPDWAINEGIVHVIPLEVDDDETYLDSDDDLDDDFDDDDAMRFTCSACAGTGQDWDLTPCQECNGEGFYYWK